jgi:hypothetical protein
MSLKALFILIALVVLIVPAQAESTPFILAKLPMLTRENVAYSERKALEILDERQQSSATEIKATTNGLKTPDLAKDDSQKLEPVKADQTTITKPESGKSETSTPAVQTPVKEESGSSKSEASVNLEKDKQSDSSKSLQKK